MSNGHKIDIHEVKVKERKQEYINPHYIPHNINTPPIKNVLC